MTRLALGHSVSEYQDLERGGSSHTIRLKLGFSKYPKARAENPSRKTSGKRRRTYFAAAPIPRLRGLQRRGDVSVLQAPANSGQLISGPDEGVQVKPGLRSLNNDLVERLQMTAHSTRQLSSSSATMGS